MFQSSGGVSVPSSLCISDNTSNLRKMKILQTVLAVFIILAISSTLARSVAGTEGDIFDNGENGLVDSEDVPRATPWPRMVKAWLDMKMID